MTVVRKELEISIVWAQTNPGLLSSALHKFHRECKEMNLRLARTDYSRTGFVTYIAEVSE